MPLYLVRHGEAHSEIVDPNRSLTESGKATVEAMAQLAAAFHIPVARILHSGKTRARQTAEIFAQYLKPAEGMAEILAINPYDDITAIAADLDPALKTLMVGHLPFMERLVSHLVVGSQEKSIIRFQTAGVVCLDRTEPNGPWHIRWALMPNMV